MFTTGPLPLASQLCPTETDPIVTSSPVCLVSYLLSVMDLNFEEMNTGMKNRWMIVAGVFFLSACVPDPLYVKNVPILQPRIVVSSQVIPGQSIAILLTKSIGALEAGSGTDAQTLLNQIVINDAVVTISYQGKTDNLQFISNGVYGTVTTPLIAGVEYHLEVSSPTMGAASASTLMKPQVKFQSVDASLYVI